MKSVLDSKKAQNITVTTIIVIVLALVVLVVLILGFTGGWGNLWERITGFFGESNVDSVVQACQLACTTQSTYDYCNRLRTVRFGDKAKDDLKLQYTCYQMEEEGVGLSGCANIDCSTSVKKCDSAEIGGEWVAKVDKKCPKSEDKERTDLTSSVTSKERKDNVDAGKLCCKKP